MPNLWLRMRLTSERLRVTCFDSRATSLQQNESWARVLPAIVSIPACTIPIKRRPFTTAGPEFRQPQLAGHNPVAHGVECHVSCDMARYGSAQGTLGFFN